MKKRAFEYYVVAILNESTVLINYGRDDNEKYLRLSLDEFKVKIGDTVEIISPGPEIFDPKTKKSLGYYDHVKEKLEIVEMYNNFSKCQKLETITTSTSNIFDVAKTLQDNVKTVKRPKKININKEQITKLETNDTSNIINVGDPVIII